MPNNIIMRRIEVTEEYRPLSERPLVMSGEINAPPFNPGPVFFRSDDGSDVPFIPGQYMMIQRCCLSEIYVKGPAGAIVVAVGGTW